MSKVEGQPLDQLKERVRAHWEHEVCGTRYGQSVARGERLREIEDARYRLEPYIPEFADFAAYAGRRVLEIGVGAGVDFGGWLAAGALASGVDLTEASIAATRERLDSKGVDPKRYELLRADAENLPFGDDEFDLVYSWGVLHHSPDTERAFCEAHRVLKPGGEFKGMIYHLPSWTGWFIWVLYGPLKGRPFLSVRRVVFEHLESPGTKAYSLREADDLLRRAGFSKVELRTKLGPGDLLLTKPSKRYGGALFRLIWQLCPRWLGRLLGDRLGLYLLIEARKA